MSKRPLVGDCVKKGKKSRANDTSRLNKIDSYFAVSKKVRKDDAFPKATGDNVDEPITFAQKAVIDAVKNCKHPELKKLIAEPNWVNILQKEFEKPYFKKLQKFLESEWDDPETVVYPKTHHIFEAFRSTPYEKVRVVLLGQDPYHGANQAMGLAFSVPKKEAIPSSLQNVYTEIRSDLGFFPGNHGDLRYWAQQGVLLLNTVLTVQATKAHSHKLKGWETFTSQVIQLLNQKKTNLVFILWGAHAHRMESLLDPRKHLILKSAHPSGLSAHRGFFGCRHFSKCNSYLESKGYKSIDWKVDAPPTISKEVPVDAPPTISKEVPVDAPPTISKEVPVDAPLTTSKKEATDAPSKVSKEVSVDASPKVSKEASVDASPKVSKEASVDAPLTIPKKGAIDASPKVLKGASVDAPPILPKESSVDASPTMSKEEAIIAPRISKEASVDVPATISKEETIDALPILPIESPVDALSTISKEDS